MLDDIKKIQKLDKSDMASFILQMPEQIEESLAKIEKIEIPTEWSKIQNICLVGMGGSAMAESLIANLPHSERKIPISVVRGYDVPAWVNQDSLIVIVSHSGNTQETLSAFNKALKLTKNIFIITTGGKIEKEAENNIILKYETKAVPRASLGYQFGAIFGLLTKLKIIDYNLQPAIELLKKINTDYEPKVETENNMAKKLAYSCLDRLPIIVGSGILQSVAWRWKTQFNENSKNIAYTEFLPEAMHNAIEGMNLPKNAQDNLIYMLLKNPFTPKELVLQFKKFETILEDKKIRYEIVEPLGDDIWSQKLSALILGDWVSYYLAILNGIDPTPVDTIERSKK
ncbi:bifunctional phosphoglucose/phosphomannose isomerase [Patescibacteria group bacterium]